MVIAVTNDKGGTGKSTTSVYLAHGLARDGKVLLIDADPSASSLQWSEMAEGFEGVDVIAMPTGDIHKRIESFKQSYRHIVIDTPPNDARIITGALLASDTVVIPLTPYKLDVGRLMRTAELIANVDQVNSPRVFGLLTRVRIGTKNSVAARAMLAEEMGVTMFEQGIPLLEQYADTYGEKLTDLGHYAAVLEALTVEV